MSDQEAIEKISDDVELAIKECGVLAIRDMPKFKQALALAKGVRALRAALDDNFVKWALMPLMGSTLGFLTDTDKEPREKQYGIQVVRDCSIEALIRGFNMTGNEFNIIAGRFYGAKNGWSRQVHEFPGLRHLVLQPGVPTAAGDKTALVPYTAMWLLNGSPMSIDCQAGKDGGPDLRIPVRVNAGMGPDAVLGKAERKMLFRIYQRLYGSTYGATDGEVGDEQAFVTTGEPAPSPLPAGTVEGRRYSIGNGKGKKQPTGDQPVANGAAAPAQSSEVKPPPPAATPAAAPADLSKRVDGGRLVQMLREIDPAWDDPDFDAREAVEAWSDTERSQALAWCAGYLANSPNNIRRPAHTMIAREPGEDG